MRQEERFNFESLQDSNTIAKYFKSLIEGFEAERLVLKSEEGTLTLHPKDMINFAVRAKKKNEKNKLTLKISWKDAEDFSDSFSITA